MDESRTTTPVVVLQPDRQSSGVKMVAPDSNDGNWKEGKRYIQFHYDLPNNTFPFVVDVICSEGFGPDVCKFAVGVTEEEEFYIPWKRLDKSGKWGLPPEKVLLSPPRSKVLRLTVEKGRYVDKGVLYFNIEYRHIEAL